MMGFSHVHAPESFAVPASQVKHGLRESWCFRVNAFVQECFKDGVRPIRRLSLLSEDAIFSIIRRRD